MSLKDKILEHYEKRDINGLLELAKEGVGKSETKVREIRMVREIINIMDGLEVEIEFKCRFLMVLGQWAESKGLTHTKITIDMKYARALCNHGDYESSLEILKRIQIVLKKLDDKQGLLESYLIETRCYYENNDIVKSRGSLTQAKAVANMIHLTNVIQAELNLLSGILAIHDGDFKTSYSYFYETWETLHLSKLPYAIPVKYMILCKILSGDYESISPKFFTSLVISTDDPTLRPVLDVLEACRSKELSKLHLAFEKWKEILYDDLVFIYYVKKLERRQIEESILKLWSAYTQISLSSLASKIGLTPDYLYQILVQLILEGKINAKIDQINEILIKIPEMSSDSIEPVMALIDKISPSIDKLDMLLSTDAHAYTHKSSDKPVNTSSDLH